MANRFSKAVAKIYTFPVFTQSFLLTKLFCTMVKYANTSGVKIIAVSQRQTHLTLKNRKKVQNHIGGVHAIAASLLAESATGIVFGMNVPDSHIPLLKSMTVNYTRRMQGDLSAVATLTDEQVTLIQSQDKGDVIVSVKITDESGLEPIDCEMHWAWVNKKR
ncbi:DUF4442 domain-containing protein [Thalassotalea atypica]|uniref:DUF4442 domain-containing protein n=1 Tax=Thalassotalea atypica TaxID=2054316 RepID=UPI0025725EB2|nr:DUF4442 domain-containing protein [Thalassotalea atypica]